MDKRDFLSRNSGDLQFKRTALGPVYIHKEGHESKRIELVSDENGGIASILYDNHIFRVKNKGSEYITFEYTDQNSGITDSVMLRMIPESDDRSVPTTLVVGDDAHENSMNHANGRNGSSRIFLSDGYIENLLDGCLRICAPGKKKGDEIGVLELCSEGEHKFLGTVRFGGHQLKEVEDATDDTDAINKRQFDTEIARLDEKDRQLDEKDRELEEKDREIEQRQDEQDEKIEDVRTEVEDAKEDIEETKRDIEDSQRELEGELRETINSSVGLSIIYSGSNNRKVKNMPHTFYQDVYTFILADIAGGGSHETIGLKIDGKYAFRESSHHGNVHNMVELFGIDPPGYVGGSWASYIILYQGVAKSIQLIYENEGTGHTPPSFGDYMFGYVPRTTSIDAFDFFIKYSNVFKGVLPPTSLVANVGDSFPDPAVVSGTEVDVGYVSRDNNELFSGLPRDSEGFVIVSRNDLERDSYASASVTVDLNELFTFEDPANTWLDITLGILFNKEGRERQLLDNGECGAVLTSDRGTFRFGGTLSRDLGVTGTYSVPSENIISTISPTLADHTNLDDSWDHWTSNGTRISADNTTILWNVHFLIRGTADTLRIINPSVASNTEARKKNFCFIQNIRKVVRTNVSDATVFADENVFVDTFGFDPPTNVIGGGQSFQEHHIGDVV